jgi:hypothetical protein
MHVIATTKNPFFVNSHLPLPSYTRPRTFLQDLHIALIAEGVIPTKAHVIFPIETLQGRARRPYLAMHIMVPPTAADEADYTYIAPILSVYTLLDMNEVVLERNRLRSYSFYNGDFTHGEILALAVDLIRQPWAVQRQQLSFW